MFNLQERVDLPAAYTYAKQYFGIGFPLPFLMNDMNDLVCGMIIGHVYKNIRKNPKKFFPFQEVCLPVVWFQHEKYICSLQDIKGQIIGITTEHDKFFSTYRQDNDLIVEMSLFSEE